MDVRLDIRREEGPDMPPTVDRVWLTTEDVSTRTAYSVEHVQDAARKGDLRSYQRRKGAPHRFHRDDVDAWVRGEVPSPIAAVAGR